MATPTALLVGLELDQADACRSALSDGARALCALDAEDALAILAVDRSPLVVVQAELHPHQRRLIDELAARVGSRIVTLRRDASAAAIERLVEGAAAAAFADARPAPSVSGTCSRVSPGRYESIATGARKRS
jgi:hypothetical protein